MITSADCAPLGKGSHLPKDTGTFSDLWKGAVCSPSQAPRDQTGFLKGRESCPHGPYGRAHAWKPRLQTPLHYPPPACWPLTSGREEMDSKLMRFSAQVGDRPLGRRQLLGPSDSRRSFPCSKRAAVRSRDNWEPVPSASQLGQHLLSLGGWALLRASPGPEPLHSQRELVPARHAASEKPHPPDPSSPAVCCLPPLPSPPPPTTPLVMRTLGGMLVHAQDWNSACQGLTRV